MSEGLMVSNEVTPDKLPDFTSFLVYKDDQLVVTQKGDKATWSYLYGYLFESILTILFMSIIFLALIQELSLLQIEDLMKAIFLFSALSFIPLLALIVRIINISEYKKPNQEVKIFLSTEEALNESLNFFLDSYNVSVLQNGKERKQEKFFLYKCVVMTDKAENGEALKDEGQIRELEDQTTSKLLLPMNRPIELRIGSKTISFSLRYTDPENTKIYQRPKELVLLVKDLSILE